MKRARGTALGRTSAWALAWAVCLLAIVSLASPAWGGPPEDPPPDETETGPALLGETEAALRDRIDARALALEKLVRGDLPADADVDALLALDFSGVDVWRAQDVLALAEATAALRAEPKSPKKKRNKKSKKKVEDELPEDPPPSANVAAARERLVKAYAAYLASSPERRAELLAEHAGRREAALADAEREERLRARLEAVRHESARLAAFMAGTLDLEEDPETLLRLNLGDEHEWLLRADRADRLVGTDESEAAPDPAEEPSAEPEDADPLSRELADAELELDRKRIELLQLTPQARAQLLATHASRVGEAAAEKIRLAQAAVDEAVAQQAVNQAHHNAAEAAEQRELALKAAAEADSEAKRAAAREEARLLGVKEAHALYQAQLATRREALVAVEEGVLEWRLKLVQHEEARGEEGSADVLYEALRLELGSARERLSGQLQLIRERASEVPEIGDAPAALAGAKSEKLEALRAELETSYGELTGTERELRWGLAEAYRNEIVALNGVRLELLEYCSADLRGRVTGLGPEGVDQVRRELSQIGLELQYRALSLPHNLDSAILGDVHTSPIPLFWWLAKLALAIVVFRWWRNRADELLAKLREPPEGGTRRGIVGRVFEGLLFYVGRVRKPLEWLALVAVFFKAGPALDIFPELVLFWLIAKWVLLGSAIILLVDGLAARESLSRGAASETAQLRLRSLRLIGLWIVWTGLVLALAENFVGEGAIYAWVLKSVWLLAVPIYLVLLNWWKSNVFDAFADEPPSGFVKWVNERREGAVGFVGATVGGAFLLGRGVLRWGMRRAATFDGTRRVLAYMFRREVAKQAEVTSQTEKLDPIDDAKQDAIAARVRDAAVIDEVAAEQLAAVADVVARPRATISALVAERGMGKTSFLERLRECTEGRVEIVACPVDGYAGFVKALAGALGLSGTPTDAGLRSALERAAPVTICIDDAQRLVRPTIGGLKGLDELGTLARCVGGEVSWVVAIGAPAWQYISRARGDRLFFDQVVRLKPWSEEQIGELLQQRAARAGIDANFDDLVVPRQFDDGGGVDPSERSEQGFFRILWDYTNGNPYVALYFWARSLFVREDGEVVARLFVEPSAEELDDLALPLQFVLRALIQLEAATTEEIVAATRLHLPEVEDAIRFLRARGYLEDREGVHRVRRKWFRAISNMLRRQHLLVA